MNLKQACKIWIALALLSGLLACGVSPYGVPVVEKSQSPQPPSAGLQRGYHVVLPGDTLYSIAWNYGFDYKDLALANHIYPPYTIKPGQKIYLRKAATPQANKPAPVVKSQPVKKPVTPAPRPASTKPVTKVVVSKPEVKKPEPQKAIPFISGSAKWLWPGTGKIIKRFSSSNSLSKGIDLAGKLGDPVKSARAGTVVYAGSGLTGYGKLVIVKHDDRYLSAYAHSSRILVVEGQQVKAGQKIAEVGSSGSRTVKLHFEIRDNGKPVDPLKLLPKR